MILIALCCTWQTGEREHTNKQTDGRMLPRTLSPCFAEATRLINRSSDPCGCHHKRKHGQQTYWYNINYKSPFLRGSYENYPKITWNLFAQSHSILHVSDTQKRRLSMTIKRIKTCFRMTQNLSCPIVRVNERRP